MSTEILRSAAADIRGEWQNDSHTSDGRCKYVKSCLIDETHQEFANGRLALAVADLLDGLAVEYDVWRGTLGGGVLPGCLSRPLDRAYELARAYLGEAL